MKKTFALLAAIGVLSAALLQPALSAMQATTSAFGGGILGSPDGGHRAAQFSPASDLDDDDAKGDGRDGRASCGEDDEDTACSNLPATGPALPPANGLFGSGTAPQAQVN